MSHPGPEAGAGDSRTRRANPALSRSWIGLPIPLLLVTILTLWRATSPDTRESWVLGLTLTILFSSLTALAATTLASLDFLASGSLGSLLLGCGALFWSGAGGIGMLLGRNDIDSQVAFHNLSAWFAAACHLAGVLLARRPRLVAAARVQLPLAYSSVVGLTLVIALAARMHLLPPFFMQGQGGTALRQAVLGSAAGMFALAGAILAVRNRTKRSTFTRWYSLSLALIAVGLVGVLLQANVGSLVGWAGRAAQFLGGVYMLVAVAAARHGSEALNRALRTSLREAEQRLQTLVDIAPDAIIAHQDGRFIYANGRALSLYGAGSAAELLGRSVLDLVHPDDRDAVRKRIALAEAGATSPLHPLRIVRLDGDAVPVETTASAFEYRGRTAIQVILRDIRERIESEQALRNSEATLDAFFESSPAVLGICDEELRILRTDTITPAVFGLTRDAVVGRPARDLAPDFVQRFGPLMRQVLDTGIPELNREVTTTVPIRGGDAAHWRVSCFPIPLSGSRRGIGVVGVEITDIKRAEAEREHLVAALREADRRKNEFLAVLSHELRNPLTPIRNSLHVLEHAVAGGPEARHAQAVIVRQVDHLVRLIDDLLDVTRISRGKIRLQRDRLDLRALARATVEDYRRGFLAKAVELETDMPAAPVWVDGDATRLAQAIGNLVANASKFTSSGDRVSLTLRRHGRDAILRVSDTGAGITPEVLDELFVPFKQAQQTLDRSQGGIGLGLALVKSFAEMHGGSVSAHSDGPGKGAAFTLTLPTVDVGARPAPAPAPATVRPRPRRILLIEDNLDAAESLQTALHFGGHQVAVARSGPEGLERVRTFLPDAVLCDIGLPGMDGFEVARRLRSDPRLGSMPLVALTGYALPDDLERARAAGFSRHLAKPADVETVLAALSELLPDP